MVITLGTDTFCETDHGLRYNGLETTWSAVVGGQPPEGSSHWGPDVFRATGGFIWLYILYLRLTGADLYFMLWGKILVLDPPT